jgi:hypothetical protein
VAAASPSKDTTRLSVYHHHDPTITGELGTSVCLDATIWGIVTLF